MEPGPRGGQGRRPMYEQPLMKPFFVTFDLGKNKVSSVGGVGMRNSACTNIISSSCEFVARAARRGN